VIKEMNSTDLTQRNKNKRRKWWTSLLPRRRRHDPREARPAGSQFHGTGWIAQPVHVPLSLRRLASIERAAGARRSGDPMLVLNMSAFNFESEWNRVFSPIRRENVWGT
jgi:hypothetical protein